MNEEIRITTIEIQGLGQLRMVAFYSFADVISCGDCMKMVLICQNIAQIKGFFPHVYGGLDAWVDLEPIRSYVDGVSQHLTLGDVSRLHNDLMLSLGTRDVVPPGFFHEWSECSNELIKPLNELTHKICAEGISQGLDTKTIMQHHSKAQDKIEFVPSEAFIKCMKRALKFVELALYLDKPVENIAPYCLIPASDYSEKPT